MICSVKSCNKKFLAKGLCSMHYSRLRRNGSVYSVTKNMDGHSAHPIYELHQSMIYRCKKAGTSYSQKGIAVCARWLGANGFSNFLTDMGERPKGTSLDRIDNTKGYSPDNCRWATPTQQVLNRGMFSNNTSGVEGVYWNKARSIWVAFICKEYKLIYLGSFVDKRDAIDVRREAELRSYAGRV